MRALGHGALGSSMARGAAASLLSWVCAELLAGVSPMPPSPKSQAETLIPSMDQSEGGLKALASSQHTLGCTIEWQL